MMQKQLSTIDQADAGDISAIAALESMYYGDEGYPAGFLYQSLAQWPEGLWVASQDQRIIGYALVVPGKIPTEYWLMAVLVADAGRGQGLGLRLCERAIAACSDIGASKLWLSVAPDNHIATALYRRLGFIDAGQHDDFLGPGQHRLLMQLTLS